MSIKLNCVLIPVASGAALSRTGRDTLVAINDVPLLEFALNEAVAAGASRIIVVAEGGETPVSRFLSSRIRSQDSEGDFFSQRTRGCIPDGVSLKLITRTQPLGFAGALLDAQPYLTGEYVGLIRLDDFVLGHRCLGDMCAVELGSPTDTLVAAVRTAEGKEAREGPLRTGGEDDGAPLSPIGRFIVPVAVVDALANQPTDATGRRVLGEAIKSVGGLRAWPVSEPYFDCSTREGLFEASVAVRTRRHTTRPISATALS